MPVQTTIIRSIGSGESVEYACVPGSNGPSRRHAPGSDQGEDVVIDNGTVCFIIETRCYSGGGAMLKVYGGSTSGNDTLSATGLCGGCRSLMSDDQSVLQQAEDPGNVSTKTMSCPR